MSVIKYLLECGESSDSQVVIDVLTEALPNESGDIMTIAQQLEQRGEQRGFKQGIELTAYNALKSGADVEFVAKITGLSLT